MFQFSALSEKSELDLAIARQQAFMTKKRQLTSDHNLLKNTQQILAKLTGATVISCKENDKGVTVSFKLPECESVFNCLNQHLGPDLSIKLDDPQISDYVNKRNRAPATYLMGRNMSVAIHINFQQLQQLGIVDQSFLTQRAEIMENWTDAIYNPSHGLTVK